MIKLVPAIHTRDISMAIARGDIDKVKRLIEINNIDADSFMDSEMYEPIIMKPLSSLGFANEEARLTMLKYLLEKGADPNRLCKAGYNCLHIAAQQTKLISALSLFLDFNGDVNITDNNGGTVAYWVIQSFSFALEGEERQLHLNLLEKTVMLGANLDHANRFGVTPRKWLNHKPEELSIIVAKCEKLNPVYKPAKTLQPPFPTNLQYPDITKKIWNELVPLYGQAETVQAELLRAIEKLRDEAQRNGNINYSGSHKKLAKFVMETLVNSTLFDKKETAKIKTQAKILMRTTPYTDDNVYDYLTDQICVFYLKTDGLIPHVKDPDIVC